MSPTLYTARNNGKENNGGNTTMVTGTTIDKQWNKVQRSSECISKFPLMSQQVEIWKKLDLGEGGLLVMWWDIQGIV